MPVSKANQYKKTNKQLCDPGSSKTMQLKVGCLVTKNHFAHCL